MKNSILTLYIFLFAPSFLLAQSDWQWGQEVRVDAKHIAVDNFGNSYVTWSLQNSYTLDGVNFVSNGGADAALTSFDCDGIHRWTKTIGGVGSDVAWGLGTDTLGGVYIACKVNAGLQENYNLNIDNDTSIVFNRKNMLLVKYDIEGTFKWLKMPEDTAYISAYHSTIRDLMVAPNGDNFLHSRLVPGTYGDGIFEASFPGSTTAGEDIYTLKYNSEGNCTGGFHFDLSYTGPSFLGVGVTEIVRDQYSGKFYMSGRVDQNNSTVIFGGEQVTAENYLVQFDPEGNVNWRISTEDSGVDNTYFNGKPSVDELGNVYVTGDSYNDNSFGDFTFENTMGTSNFPIFAKIDSMGNVLYATNASVPGVSKGKATAYSNNKVGLTGSYASEIHWGDMIVENADNSQLTNVFLTLFNPLGDGLPTSIDALYGSANGNEYPSLLTADNQGNFYVGGNFSGQLYVGDDTLYNQSGAQEGFIAKFGTDSCACPLPEAAFMVDSLPNQAEYVFEFTGTAEVDSVVWDFGDGITGVGLSLQHLFAETGTYTICATAYNDCGPDSVCITIDALGPVGVKAIEGFENILLYPNPAKDMLTIGNATPGTRVSVINAVGQEMQSALLLSSTSQLDISRLPAGVYLLQMIDVDGKVGYGRFMKE